MTAVFIDVEVMQDRLGIVVEPSSAAPYKVIGDDWLRMVLGPLLFDADHERGETPSGEQLYKLVVAEDADVRPGRGADVRVKPGDASDDTATRPAR